MLDLCNTGNGSAAPASTFSSLYLDESGIVRNANDAAARLLGFADAEALLRCRHRCPEITAARDRLRPDSGERPWRALQLRNRQGDVVPVLARDVGSDSEGFHVLLSRQATESVDVHVGAEWCIPLIELSQSGLFVKTLDSKLLYVNEAMARSLDYKPAEMTGRSCSEFFVEEDLRRFAGQLLERPLCQDETREMVVRARMKNGSVRNVKVCLRAAVYDSQDVLVGSVLDVTDLHHGEKVLKDYAMRLRRLSQDLLAVQEMERGNLARELHDEVGGQLTMLKLTLAGLQARNADVAPELEDAVTAVSSLMCQVRELSLDLRPSMLDDLGLPSALRWYASRVARLADMSARLDIAADFPRLQTETETLFYRVAQEAITNVMRHSGASRLHVGLHVQNGEVVLEVSDNGKGFDADSARDRALQGGSAGLLGMQERASLGGAQLELSTAPGKGTQLRLSTAWK